MKSELETSLEKKTKPPPKKKKNQNLIWLCSALNIHIAVSMESSLWHHYLHSQSQPYLNVPGVFFFFLPNYQRLGISFF